MSRSIVHVEFAGEDRRELAEFYSSIFGWELQEFPDMNYTTFSSGQGGLGGGFAPVGDINPRGAVVVYIDVDDVEATLDAIEERGGKRLHPPLDIPGVGTIAHFTDPGGNRVAVIKGAEGAM
jgi:uncharacterized protein